MNNFLLCRKYIGQIFTDCLVHNENALKYLVDTMGEVRIFVSDAYSLSLNNFFCGTEKKTDVPLCRTRSC